MVNCVLGWFSRCDRENQITIRSWFSDHNSFAFCFSLVDKKARVLPTNHKAKLRRGKLLSTDPNWGSVSCCTAFAQDNTSAKTKHPTINLKSLNHNNAVSYCVLLLRTPHPYVIYLRSLPRHRMQQSVMRSFTGFLQWRSGHFTFVQVKLSVFSYGQKIRNKK